MTKLPGIGIKSAESLLLELTSRLAPVWAWQLAALDYWEKETLLALK
ncbi:MAG: hypothetical protein V4805_06175 [Pseudomonadota bacterium]